MRGAVAVVVALGAAVLAACGGAAATSPPDTAPDVSGTVTQVDTDAEGLGTVLVEEDPARDSGDTKIAFRVTADTTILREADGGHEPAALADVAVGATVSAWSTGPVAESYPMQATAGTIVLHEPR